MNSLVRAVVRLCTATGTPRRAMLRARFAPITASPVTPMRLSPMRGTYNSAIAGTTSRPRIFSGSISCTRGTQPCASLMPRLREALAAG